MKFKLVLIFLFVIYFSYSVFSSPIDVTFDRNSYSPGETVQGKIIIDPNLEDEIKSTDFLLRSNETSLDVYPTLIKLPGYTYFYFDLPYSLNPFEYNLIVEDIIYNKEGILVQEDKNFSLQIVSTNNSIISLSDGILLLRQSSDSIFEISFFNPTTKESKADLTIEDNFISINKISFTVKPNKIQTVEGYLLASLVNKQTSTILVKYDNGEYIIPVFIEDYSGEEIIPEIESQGPIILEEKFDLDIEQNESVSGFIKIQNTFPNDIENVELVLSDEFKNIIDLQYAVISVIKSEEVVKNNLYVNERKETLPGNYSGNLDLIYQGKKYDTVPIKVEVKQNLDNISNITKPIQQPIEEPEDNRVYIIGILVLILLILVVFVLYRYKTSKN